ncbi:SubName: Full=Related to NADH-ubiquinone oxidoreductase 21.3 kDa subunit {ECO:0000313/EMBL:CCA67566.1} [Serendipita indica DSM 11827]|uniref:Related to NADH-ubiquinone oxidoreductase 21.3 kDa subunit n=1 Tax=Serendipita indica (strain DSM 11827) TaxID=1109443 RepID=G4T8C1_SERID|nr:SubName: Full=Related to NADH-ubiquinone oxidoreductase 21.3 kDa subunit {ECO:0000313/EMBL:CCA67566.1} [Serendipita indica DSM 11827]CCA67566.1 related to NADH-ubiquinone oxidoreductase 21.3 kDa subunit [Serendipita indica DSM 11827]
MAGKRLADQTLYHLSPKGFWKKFRDVMVVNPEISSGLPLPDKNRYPQPGSRPELYSTPATMASDVAQNPYWKRDVRRAYPQLSVVTQAEYSKVLLASPQGQSIAPPKESSEESEKSSVPATETNKSLSEVLEAINKLQPVFSESNLPPTPSIITKWTPVQEEDAPHDPNAYWPMKLYK